MNTFTKTLFIIWLISIKNSNACPTAFDVDKPILDEYETFIKNQTISDYTRYLKDVHNTSNHEAYVNTYFPDKVDYLINIFETYTPTNDPTILKREIEMIEYSENITIGRNNFDQQNGFISLSYVYVRQNHCSDNPDNMTLTLFYGKYSAQMIDLFICNPQTGSQCQTACDIYSREWYLDFNPFDPNSPFYQYKDCFQPAHPTPQQVQDADIGIRYLVDKDIYDAIVNEI